MASSLASLSSSGINGIRSPNKIPEEAPLALFLTTFNTTGPWPVNCSQFVIAYNTRETAMRKALHSTARVRQRDAERQP
jgi:hypothetical protein